MPIFSPDELSYNQRAHRNERPENHEFTPNELLFRRYRENDLVNGRPTPLGFSFAETTGHSVNRGNYSQPQDVLEPDCCDGHARSDCVVLEFNVADVPGELVSSDQTRHTYFFRLKHVPKATCFAHSEMWCNQQGNIHEPYQYPPKNVRDRFRAELIRRITLPPRRFDPVSVA